MLYQKNYKIKKDFEPYVLKTNLKIKKKQHVYYWFLGFLTPYLARFLVPPEGGPASNLPLITL